MPCCKEVKMGPDALWKKRRCVFPPGIVRVFFSEEELCVCETADLKKGFNSFANLRKLY